MSQRVEVIWDEAYTSYDFGSQHPLKPVRLRLTIELARACGVLGAPNVSVRPPRAATRAELETVHVPAYVDAVERISSGARSAYGEYGWGIGTGDNPAFAGMHDACALIAGGSIVAAQAVWLEGADHAFNVAGGATHHAMPDHASGFGVYNDLAIAIRWLLANGASRVAYVDVDVHHGDGVQAAFYDEPRVLTISLHESGHFLFPGTGFADEVGRGSAEGTKVNVPLPPYTHDGAYQEAFERIVPPLIESFRPDVIVTQLGCDTHVTDPLAHFALTTRSYRYLGRAFHQLAHDVARGRWLATGGGGYQVYAVVPRAWTIYLAELAGASLPPEVPPSWCDLARASGATDLFTRFDDPEVELPSQTFEDVGTRARASAEQTAARVFPYHGISSRG